MNSLYMLRFLELALCLGLALWVSHRLCSQTGPESEARRANVEEAQRMLGAMFRRWGGSAPTAALANRPPAAAETLRSPLVVAFLLMLALLLALHPDGTGAWLGSGLPAAPKGWALLVLEVVCVTFALVGVVLNVRKRISS